ncbi:MAG: methionine--tRNA ligase [Firmicutes bacterium]|nr:methionine--tRNA ligase [Bacillota bacterium]
MAARTAGGRYSLTVAIDYPNGEPHLGHAYEKVAADAIARYHRLMGREVAYVAGTDEHSANVARAAREQGLSPQDYVDRMAQVFRSTWDGLGVGYTVFRQTSDPRHVAAVQHFVQRIHDAGYVYPGTYSGWYCLSCEAFYTEKDVPGRVCPVHGRPVEWLEEKNYFFRLSAFTDRLRRHYEEHPDFVLPETRRHEMESVLREGLEDLSISRAGGTWGVPLPWDPDHTVYVWFDALLTYISALGYPDPDSDFGRFWPADLHLIGKDITRFHCLVWPAMLMAAGLPLPRHVFGHGFMSANGERLSKTTGNVIDPLPFARRYGLDATRYYLLAETPFGQDGNLAPAPFVKRVNSDLANDLGNLLHRTLAMIGRFAAGRVPDPPAEQEERSVLRPVWEEALERYHRAFEEIRPDLAADALLAVARRANKYIDEAAPWRLAREADGEVRLRRALHDLAETLRLLAVAYRPFLVEAPGTIGDQLGVGAAAVLEAGPDDLVFGRRLAGVTVRPGAPLFPRLDADEVVATAAGFGAAAEAAAARARAAADPPAPPPAADPPEVGIEEVRRLDLRVATVVAAERVAGTDRLLRLRVDAGEGRERTIVSGIAAAYEPAALVGRQIVLVANLRPATIRGIVSEGMLLAAHDGRGLSLLTADRVTEPGAAVS